MPPREYVSPVREQQKTETDARILDAAVRVILDDGIDVFTISNVAKRAGVAHRTVYRYYPTRTDLLVALSARLDASTSEPKLRASNIVGDVARADETVRFAFSRFEENFDTTRAMVIAAVALRFSVPGRQQRTAAIEQAMAEQYPHLPTSEVRAAGHALRSLIGSRTWFTMREEQGLSARETIEAVAWGLHCLLEALATREAEARAGRGGKR